MTRRKRRILFYALTVLFAVAGPLIVAYAVGYAFNFSTAHFDQTGGVFIKSKTSRLSVFLDGAFVKETGLLAGSALLPDILPSTHLVRLEKTGFRSWSKTIAVAPAEVVELRNILLVPHPVSIATSTKEEMASAAAISTPALVLTLDARGRLFAGRGRDSKIIIENVHSYTLANNIIFFVDKNGFFAHYNIATKEIMSIGRPGFFLTSAPLLFIAGQRFVAIIDPSGGLFLFDKDAGTLSPVTGNVKNVSFDGSEEKMLLARERSISILWLTDNTHQPFQKKGAIEQVISADQPIRDAQWLYKTDSHIVWRDRDGVSFTEIDQRGGANTAELVQGPVDEIATFPSLPSAIFYRRGKNFYKIGL